jgi:hypothetical protein
LAPHQEDKLNYRRKQLTCQHHAPVTALMAIEVLALSSESGRLRSRALRFLRPLRISISRFSTYKTHLRDPAPIATMALRRMRS